MSDEKTNDPNKIIDLPTRAQERHKWQNRLKDQRAVSVISLGSVVMVCLLINQYLNVQQESIATKNREVASVGSPINTEKNVKWEQYAAEDLNRQHIRMIQADKPENHDQLIYGELKGQYMAHLDSDFKIRKLVLTSSAESEVIDPQAFLLTKKDAWSVRFDRVEVAEDDGVISKINLYRGSQKVGVANIEKNPFGKLKSLEIQ